jgi:hypothetical protein
MVDTFVDEQSKAAGMARAAELAKTMPKVNPLTGNLPDVFAGKFGFTEALKDDPIYGAEIREIIAALNANNNALAETLYRKSKWAQLDTDAQDAYLLKIQNSKLYKERLTSWMLRIKKVLATRGLKADDATLEKYYVDGIDDLTIIDELSNGITAKDSAGEIADSLSQLRTTARNNGFNLDKDFAGQLDGWMRDIAKGLKSVDDIARLIRSQAKLGLPEKVGALLDEGLDLANIYAPYRNTMASLLEVMPDSISLDDPLLRTAYGPDSEMSLYDFKRSVRKDPRWQYTDNARQDVANSALSVLRDFGFQG